MMTYLAKHNALIVVFLLGLLAVSQVFSQNIRPSIRIPLYFSASCHQLTGTWSGTYVDPQSLLVDRAITVTMQLNDDRVIGRVTSSGPGNVTAINGLLWGRCHHGVLSHVFVGSSKQCGHFAPPGGMVAANMIILYFPYENAMAGTDVIAVLHRKNHQYTGKSSIQDKDTIQTCH